MKFEKVIFSIKKLINNNFKEIILTGVNTAGYNDGVHDFYDLLLAIDRIRGDFRIRISSLEPFQITNKIIDLLTKNKRR
jgi:threonylcarbamoyladenosine tRNA methylthiotransferase MtaB